MRQGIKRSLPVRVFALGKGSMLKKLLISQGKPVLVWFLGDPRNEILAYLQKEKGLVINDILHKIAPVPKEQGRLNYVLTDKPSQRR